MTTPRFPLLLILLLLALAWLVIGSTALPAGSAAANPPPIPSPAFGGMARGEGEMPINQIIIKYRAGALLQGAAGPADAAQMRRLSDAAGAPLSYFRAMSGGAHVLRLPTRLPPAEVQAIADRLAALPEVAYAEPDAIMRPMLTPNDPRYGDQWHYAAPTTGRYGINAAAAWDITTGSASIVVAVVDTGITNHADLSGRTVAGYDFISDVWTANDGDGRDSDPHDPGDWVTLGACGPGSPAQNSSWHGTHVAGTIGAATNNSIGVAGINWQSAILPVRVLGRCGGTISDIADGMRWAAGLSVPGAPTNAHPAKVINLSLGGYGPCSTTYQEAINAIVATGATVVVAAGNSDDDATDYRPGNCNGVITVAATNRNGSRAYYSNYGSVVEISAPGGETNPISSNGILSTLNSGTQGPAGDTYAYYQGTSMAAPHVAGVVSLLYSLNPALTSSQILALLQSTVTNFPAGSSCNTSICGAGIVNAAAAVAAANTTPTPTATPTRTVTPTGGVTPTPTRTPTPTGSTTPGALTRVRLPLILRDYPPLPAAPVLNEIANADGDGNYTVSWNASARSVNYELQEDDNASFASPETRYTGGGLSWNASGKAVGTYYYRVRGQNGWGNGGWSNVASVVVLPPGPTPGYWRHPNGNMEFYVTADRRYVDRFAIYVSVSGCGDYKITHLVQEAISGNSFSFGGPFYASGTFSSPTTASGTTGLNDFYISGCGYVTGGPWSWTASWMHAAALQAPAAAVEAERVESADAAHAFAARRTP